MHIAGARGTGKSSWIDLLQSLFRSPMVITTSRSSLKAVDDGKYTSSAEEQEVSLIIDKFGMDRGNQYLSYPTFFKLATASQKKKTSANDALH